MGFFNKEKPKIELTLEKSELPRRSSLFLNLPRKILFFRGEKSLGSTVQFGAEGET